MTPRAGIGFDIHRLVRGRPFLLAGILLAHPKGPLGHSDGDPLAHAAVDALLGAAGLGDIGEHFPDSDPRWKGASGTDLLRRTAALLRRKGFRIASLDANVLCERPRLGQAKARIRAALARALRVPASSVNVKARTMEGLGDIGAGRAVAAQAVATVVRRG